MSELSDRGSGIEITQHPHFESHWRGLQRVFFTVMVVLVVAGMLGVLGSGPMAKTALDYPDAKVEVQRFARAGASQQIEVDTQGSAVGPLDVHIDKDLATKLGIEATAPAPSSSQTGAGGTSFVYTATPGGGTIVIKGKPQEAGLARGVIAINGHAQNVSQIVWP